MADCRFDCEGELSGDTTTALIDVPDEAWFRRQFHFALSTMTDRANWDAVGATDEQVKAAVHASREMILTLNLE